MKLTVRRILSDYMTVYVTFAACLDCNVIHVSLKSAAGVVGEAYAQLIGDDLRLVNESTGIEP